MRLLWSDEVEQRIRSEAHSIDEQTTPEEVKFCTRCVVSNQRPRIVFDDVGVCSACRYAEHKKSVDWDARADELHKLFENHRRSHGSASVMKYDVIVPCSGGKDSSTVAHRLKHEFGMHPLCVTWAPFAYTDIGRQNFDAFVNSGFDVITAQPNGLLHRKLARLAFEYLGDAWQPFTYGQINYAMHMAYRFGVDLVMFGENGEAEYGGDPAANDKPCWGTEDWERIYLKGAAVDRLFNIGIELGAISTQEVLDSSPFYRLPKPMSGRPYPQFHWFGYYTYWHPQANYYHACEHTGFTANSARSEGTYSKYASLDDKLDGFHYYMAFMKFGIGRCTSDAAHEVRDGEITREEAVALVKRFEGEFPARYFEEFLAYLDLDNEQFWRVANRFRKRHIWKANSTEYRKQDEVYWDLRHASWYEKVEAA